MNRFGSLAPPIFFGVLRITTGTPKPLLARCAEVLGFFNITRYSGLTEMSTQNVVFIKYFLGLKGTPRVPAREGKKFGRKING